jgi:hypothetical protein
VDGTAFHAYSGAPIQMGEFYKEFPEKSVYFTPDFLYRTVIVRSVPIV